MADTPQDLVQDESAEALSSPPAKRICIQNNMGFMQETSSPCDVKLKMPDGSIDAHRVMLSTVSPVFDRMLCGSFKEADLKEVSLPCDSYKIMKLLLDVILKQYGEMESLDDVIPLMEVAERYQINKSPLQCMLGEAILTQLSSSNYHNLLAKFYHVMSKDSLTKATDMIMDYTDNNIFDKFEQDRYLPEEILLRLLCHQKLITADLKIFLYLAKWHNYQSKTLKKSSQMASRLFECIRYTRITPQMLFSTVVGCELIDQTLVRKALQFLYNSVDPLERDEHCYSFCAPHCREPAYSMLEWKAGNSIVQQKLRISQACASFVTTWLFEGDFDDILASHCIIKSQLLPNKGIYTFTLSLSRGSGLLFSVKDSSAVYLFSATIRSNNMVTLNVYENMIFLKIIDKSTDKFASVSNIRGRKKFQLCIGEPPGNCDKSFSFTIKSQSCS